MTNIDLHMHSKISLDGEFTPDELMEKCHKKGLKVVSLTDHNSVRGIEEAMASAIRLKMTLIPGIELDCSFEDKNLHILGYGIDFHDPRFTAYEEYVLAQEVQSARKRVELIRALGITISDKRIAGLSIGGVVTGEMIAEAALSEESNRDHPLMQPYYPGGKRSDNPFVNFYWDLCAKGKIAYVEISYMSLEEAVHLIKATGGIPVFAHPGNNIGRNEDLLKGIIAAGVEGIEAYSSYHTIETTNFYLEKVEEMKLLLTSGSDYHGKIKPGILLGGTGSDEQEHRILQGLQASLK